MNKLKKFIKDLTTVLFSVSTTLVALDLVITQVLEIVEKVLKFFNLM